MADGRIQSHRAFAASPSYRAYSTGRPKFVWDFLKPAFDWGIAPTDIDGLVERKGHYLLFECKNKGAVVGTGQSRMLDDLNSSHGFTIFIVTGWNSDTVDELEIRWPRGVRVDQFPNDVIKTVNSAFLLRMARRWFDWVEQRKQHPGPCKLTPQEQTIQQWLADYDAYGEKRAST